MISKNTREGVAAAAASDKTLGRPAALNQECLPSPRRGRVLR